MLLKFKEHVTKHSIREDYKVKSLYIEWSIDIFTSESRVESVEVIIDKIEAQITQSGKPMPIVGFITHVHNIDLVREIQHVEIDMAEETIEIFFDSY